MPNYNVGSQAWHCDPNFNKKGPTKVTIVTEQPGGLGYVISHPLGLSLEAIKERKDLYGYSDKGKLAIQEILEEYNPSGRYLFSPDSWLKKTKIQGVNFMLRKEYITPKQVEEYYKKNPGSEE